MYFNLLEILFNNSFFLIFLCILFCYGITYTFSSMFKFPKVYKHLLYLSILILFYTFLLFFNNNVYLIDYYILFFLYISEEFLYSGSLYNLILHGNIHSIVRIEIDSTLGVLTFYITPVVYDSIMNALDNPIVRAGLTGFSERTYTKYSSLNYRLLSVEYISCEKALLEMETLYVYDISEYAVYCHSNGSLYF